MAVTIQEIAEQANCSATTVSFVLSNRQGHNISKELCAKINALAEKHHYRRKAPRREGSVAMVLPPKVHYNASPYYASVSVGLGGELNSRGYSLSLEHLETSSSRSLEDVLEGSCGVALCAPPPPEVAAKLPGLNKAVVTLGFTSGAFPRVGADVFEAAMDAVGQLKRDGHRRVVFAGSLDYHPDFLERYQCFLAGAAYHGLAHGPDHLIKTTGEMLGSYEQLKTYLGRLGGEGMTTLFCGSELEAAAAMKAAQDLGLSIPDQISILAFGYGSYPFPFAPGLALVKVDAESVGRLLGKTLLAELERPCMIGGMRCAVAATFIPGDSCAANLPNTIKQR